MKPAPTTLFALLAILAAPAAASPSVREFELPPGPTATPTSGPQVQGPVDPDAPVATRPRPVESPAPTPTVQPTTAPRVDLPAPPRTTPSDSPRASASGTPAPADRAAAADEVASPTLSESGQAAPAPTEAAPPAVQPAPSAKSAPTVPSGSLGWIVWPGGGLALLVALLAGGLLWWRRRRPAAAQIPRIELPLVHPERQPAPAPVSPPAPAAGPVAAPAPASSTLRIEAIPSHLTRSLMAATFSCRVTLSNRGDRPLENVTVGVDLTTAHGSVSPAEQLADPARALPEAGRIARIAPGESVEFAHEVRLPTADIRTLRQGQAHLYVPLLRVRAQAGGDTPVARTFIVGTLPDAGAKKLQPFRLDEMPQTYRMIGVAALD